MSENKNGGLRVFHFNNDINIPSCKETINKKGWINHGPDNLYAYYLIDLLNRGTKHNAICKTKSMMIGGNGFVMPDAPSKDYISFLQNYNGSVPLKEVLARCAYDLTVFSGFYLNVVWSNDRTSISSIEHIPFQKVSIAEADLDTPNADIPYYWVSQDWRELRKYPAELFQGYSTVKKQKASQILYVKEYRVGDEDYSVPEYISAIPWIELENEIANFHLSNIRNGFAPSFAVNFSHGIPTEDEMDNEIRKLKKQFEGSSNAGNVLFTFSDGPEKAPIITPIQMNDNDDRFKTLIENVDKGIYEGHQITNTSLFGVAVAGKLGTTTELIDELARFQSQYITPKQLLIQSVFNKLAKVNGIQEKIELSKYKLDIEIKPDLPSLLAILQLTTLTPEQKVILFEKAGLNKEDAKVLSVSTQNNPTDNG
jgi:hypothetical protein